MCCCVSGLSSLVELDLANNFLESVPVSALSPLKNIKFLNLGSNKIKVIFLGLFSNVDDYFLCTLRPEVTRVCNALV